MAGYYTELGIPTNTMRALVVFGPLAVGAVSYLTIKERFQTTPTTATASPDETRED
jgi:hypothetical protein